MTEERKLIADIVRAQVDETDDGFMMILNGTGCQLFDDTITALNYVSWTFIESQITTRNEEKFVIDILPDNLIGITDTKSRMLMTHNVGMTLADITILNEDGEEGDLDEGIEALIDFCIAINTTYVSTINAAFKHSN